MGNFEKYGNIMIDLETLSTKTNAAIVEIGLVEFNKCSGELGEKLDIHILPSEWGTCNRHIDGNTVSWWMLQNEDARKNIAEINKENGCIWCHYKEALEVINHFISRCDTSDKEAHNRVVVWGNGSTMDITILQSLYEYFNMRLPWKYWAVNDVRTIVDLNHSIKDNYKFNGIKHSAVDDCVHQIGYLSETIKEILTKK